MFLKSPIRSIGMWYDTGFVWPLGKGPCNTGIQIFAVMIGGISRARFVHRLVAETFFVGQSEQNNVVNHIHGRNPNNHCSNLEWTTASENSKHAFVIGLNPTPAGRKINQYDRRTSVFGVLLEKCQGTIRIWLSAAMAKHDIEGIQMGVVRRKRGE